jgi:hypothetical protein
MTAAKSIFAGPDWPAAYVFGVGTTALILSILFGFLGLSCRLNAGSAAKNCAVFLLYVTNIALRFNTACGETLKVSIDDTRSELVW